MRKHVQVILCILISLFLTGCTMVVGPTTGENEFTTLSKEEKFDKLELKQKDGSYNLHYEDYVANFKLGTFLTKAESEKLLTDFAASMDKTLKSEDGTHWQVVEYSFTKDSPFKLFLQLRNQDGSDFSFQGIKYKSTIYQIEFNNTAYLCYRVPNGCTSYAFWIQNQLSLNINIGKES